MSATRLARRVIARLAEAEVCESNPHYCDDLRIARLTVSYAATGEAILCSPHVLASYRVLGLHPEKVWPAIEARRKALGPLDVWGTPVVPIPKKPVQSVKLWCEKTNAARAATLRGGETLLRDNTISVPMAAPSIAALYPNSDAPHSGKTRQYSLAELKFIVGYSGAPDPICALTISALRARGEWPNQDGPATTTLSVAILGMMFEGVCCRSTVQRRIKRAVELGYWRRVQDANSWTDCPKCHAKRTAAKCGSCEYRGKSKDAKGNWTGEFMRVPVYEFDVRKFQTAQRCREIRHFDARTYSEYKAAAKRGDHPNVTEMPVRKTPQPDPPSPPEPAPAAPAAPVKQPAAEYAHRNTARVQPTPMQPKLTRRESARFVADVVALMKGRGTPPGRTEPDPACAKCNGSGEFEHGGHPGTLWRCECWAPLDPNYRPPMKFDEALVATAARWKRDPEVARHALRCWGYQLQ